jgi:6-phosphogluconolactonase (cycloisomerase 2 family)
LAQPSAAAGAEYAYSANLNQVTECNVDLTSGALSVSANVPGPNDAGGMVADPSAKFLYVSDFTGNAIEGFAINAATGGLTPISGSPFPVGNGNGPSGMAIDSAGKFLFLAHANLNSIFAFTRDASTGALTSVPGSPFAAGTNPFHLAVYPSGNFLYASNSNDPMGSISAYTIDPTGALTEIAGSPFATQAGYPGPGRLAIEPLGKFLYVGLGGTVNANHFVAAFSIDPSTGGLTAVPGSPFPTGNGPFSIAVDQSGKHLYAANSHDNTISAFTIDAATGTLTSVSGSPFATGAVGGFPFALAIDPAGMFLYTANQGADNISGLSVNGTTGALTPIPGSPFAGVMNAFDLTIVKIP